MNILVPPVKCQGIKTKLVPAILRAVPQPVEGTWVEPFCGSGVVALNVRPHHAILADSNRHIIGLYRAIQSEEVTSGRVRVYLEEEGHKLSHGGEKYYMEVRARFNEGGNPLDFLFLSRSCFNGLMRFNSKGKFNVPFCHKPDRFAPAYISKIVNQVGAFADVLRGRDWRFEVQDFRETLSQAQPHDFVYADPPYAGRHVDYYNSWKPEDEETLVSMLQQIPCKFLLSTWHSNKYRDNTAIARHWVHSGCYVTTFEHFYHVGPTEDLRNSMTEALISNYVLPSYVEPSTGDMGISRSAVQLAMQF